MVDVERVVRAILLDLVNLGIEAVVSGLQLIIEGLAILCKQRMERLRGSSCSKRGDILLLLLDGAQVDGRSRGAISFASERVTHLAAAFRTTGRVVRAVRSSRRGRKATSKQSHVFRSRPWKQQSKLASTPTCQGNETDNFVDYMHARSARKPAKAKSIFCPASKTHDQPPDRSSLVVSAFLD